MIWQHHQHLCESYSVSHLRLEICFVIDTSVQCFASFNLGLIDIAQSTTKFSKVDFANYSRARDRSPIVPGPSRDIFNAILSRITPDFEWTVQPLRKDKMVTISGECECERLKHHRRKGKRKGAAFLNGLFWGYKSVTRGDSRLQYRPLILP